MSTRDKSIPQIRNAIIIVLQLIAIVTCFLILRVIDSGWALFVLALVFGIVMNSVYSIIHEAHHGMLFKNRSLNDSLGIVMSLFFPAPFHLLRQGHIGHHVRNRSDDEVFDLYFDEQDKICKVFVWYGILTGFYWVLAVLSNFALIFAPVLLKAAKYRWHRTFEAFLESFNPKYMLVMRVEAIGAILLHTIIIFALGISFWKYFAMYYGFGLMWSSMQYVHHYAAERDVLNGARNLYVWKLLDLVWLNHNLHRTHHQNPSIPWCYLPKIAEQEKEPVSFLLRFYLAMWKGPKHTTERVINRYAGKIIG